MRANEPPGGGPTTPPPAWASGEVRLKVALCLERFDCARVAVMMAAVGWTWRIPPIRPAADDIEACAADLLESAHALAAEGNCPGGEAYSSTGGLTASWHRDRRGDWWPWLRFVGEEADADDGSGDWGDEP